MTQNRNKLLDLFIGNISNAVLHRILEDAIDNPEIANMYEKELTTSFAIAMKYREKINPISEPLPQKDQEFVEMRIIKKVRAELLTRIANGYQNINIKQTEIIVQIYLKGAMVK